MFENLRRRIHAIAHHLRNGYADRQGDVRQLVADARAELEAEFGMVAVWEAEELAAAEAMVNSNWLMASVHSINKALDVSQLRDDEYWGGYRYTKPNAEATPRFIKKP